MYSKKALNYAKVFVDGDIIDPSKIELAAENIQQIMFDMQLQAMEDAATIAEELGRVDIASEIRFGLTQR